ncbi:MAG: DUF5005 domain-containing protein [Saprospiraceae bacterium]
MFSTICSCQLLDTSRYEVKVEFSPQWNDYFNKDLVWRGADGASSIDLEDGHVLWLFSDSFICRDSTGSRRRSTLIRNSIAIQNGYGLHNASLKYYLSKLKNKPQAFFKRAGHHWIWTGHGVMIKDKLLIFLMKVRHIKSGLGFEIYGWNVVFISNPHDQPSAWKMQYINGPKTFGTIAGSAAILKDDHYLYAFGAVEPTTHEVYLLRWDINEAYAGNLANPQWWMNDKWAAGKTKSPIPKPLFTGSTEYSIHYESNLKKYIQIQAFGFGEGTLGLRMSDHIEGPWTEPYMFYTPQYPGVKKPFMYSAKAHPELRGDGIYITYNVNSFDDEELLDNMDIYFPKFILMKIVERDIHDEDRK